ncbi:hypothetical protein [Clostridium septicum]|uniref:hypothetical protein n=1 Tax=Clostridium septicum TaxID=1504 RepID=UPI0013E89E67|nr:hypothetical protein [Clostridium septicum]
MKSLNYKVIRVNALDNHKVLVEFDNGENRIVDAMEFIKIIVNYKNLKILIF